MARCTASASRASDASTRGNRRCLAFGQGARDVTSITEPFSACMQIRAPFFAVCESASVMVAPSNYQDVG
jgi:hypothetical protein